MLADQGYNGNIMINRDRPRRLKLWISQKLSRTQSKYDALERFAFYPRVFSFLSKTMRRRLPEELLNSSALFIHVPKNGGTSIKRTLYSCHVGHETIRFYTMSAPELLHDARTFAVIRHPLDRFLSAFDFLSRGGGEHVGVLAWSLKQMRGITTVQQYLRFLEQNRHDWLRVDNPARPQWWYITDAFGIVKTKELYLNGSSPQSVDRLIMEMTGKTLPILNKTKRRTREVSNDELTRIINLYRPDFALFKLLKDNPNSLKVAYGRDIKEISKEFTMEELLKTAHII